MKHSIRNWHTWASVVLGVPLVLVGLTTIFIAHEKSLGTREFTLPGTLAPEEPPEIRAWAWDGQEPWVGTKHGLFRVQGGQAIPLTGGPVDEIRSISFANGYILMAGKKGLWRMEKGHSERIHKDDCWQVSPAPVQGFTAVCKNSGLLTSDDGRTWASLPVAFNATDNPASTDHQGIPLSKLVMDLHTGKFFFGKEYEWIWIDLLGLACIGLGLTGFVMWMRGRRQRATAAG